MTYYIERLNHELHSILHFWQNYVFQKGIIACEVNSDGTKNETAPTGSIYISRITYGASAACLHLHDNSFRSLADIAYLTLTNKLKNPEGGYYWGFTNDGTLIHDENNISLAQAFALYGITQYAAFTGNNQALKEADDHYFFIQKSLKHADNFSYLDGFTKDWKPSAGQGYSLGTHIHLLEAFISYYNITKYDQVLFAIEGLISTIMHYFIRCETGEVIHNFDPNWKPLPNETWIGHNMETSWILCRAAKTTGNTRLIDATQNTALIFCDKAIELAFDPGYGGMFNKFREGVRISDEKEWWTQAESVIALLNAYSLSNDKRYLSYSIRLLEYIDNTFSDPHHGEWYDSVAREGMPIYDRPKLHFWKSMYHNVRYCIESANYLKKIFTPVV